MADRFDNLYRDEYRGRGRDDRGFVDRTRDEVRSWFGDEEAEWRRRMDERERGRGYRPESRQEWGDDPYRGETLRSGETWRGYPGERDYRPYERQYGAGYEPWRFGFATGRGPKGYQRSDARVNEDVCDRLCDAPDIDASDIEVRVSNGEVTLSGSVTERWQKRRAEDVVEHVSGVRDVHNNLRVSGPHD